MSGDNSSGAGAGASRGPQGSSGHTTLSPAYETRELKIAYGIQFHPGESLDKTPQQYLTDHLHLSADLEKVNDTEYISHVQGVRFTIEESTSKQQFITWLKTPEIHLIYMGHARYGRGPCFGAQGISNGALVQTEDWEEGSDAVSGIFRMGYPYIGIEASEVIEHGYTCNPVKESEGRPARADCDPDMRGYVGSLRARTPEQIHAGLAAHFGTTRPATSTGSMRPGSARPLCIMRAGRIRSARLRTWARFTIPQMRLPPRCCAGFSATWAAPLSHTTTRWSAGSRAGRIRATSVTHTGPPISRILRTQSGPGYTR